MDYSDVKNVTARKQHKCMNCGEKILIGEAYNKWTTFNCGDVGINKMHIECYEALSGDGEFEYSLYDGERPSKRSLGDEHGT